MAIVCLLISLLSRCPLARGQAPYPTFVNRTTVNGLGNNRVTGVYVVGSVVYAATNGGLSISTDGGRTFTNKTTDDGLGNNLVLGVYVFGSSIYAATAGGLSISTDAGKTFANKTTDNGLGSNVVTGVCVDVNGRYVYVATLGGWSYSPVGGNTFTNITTKDNVGLRSNNVFGITFFRDFVYAATDAGLTSYFSKDIYSTITPANGLGSNFVSGVSGDANGRDGKVYVATSGGLSVNIAGGSSFVNKTTANGLGSNVVNGVYAKSINVYAATQKGVSISTDQGTSFINRSTANGLGSEVVNGVYASDGIVYAATDGGLSISVSALPVKLVYFTGRPITQGNQLKWQTSQETNNAGFTLLRGSSPTGLEPIASLPSQAQSGNASDMLTYSFIDHTPPPGLSYYQLRQTDLDGQQTLSQIIGLRSQEVTSVLFPNPVPADGHLRLEPPQAFDHYELLDASGRVVQQGKQAGTLSEVTLPAGGADIYWLHLQYGDQIQVYRILR